MLLLENIHSLLVGGFLVLLYKPYHIEYIRTEKMFIISYYVVRLYIYIGRSLLVNLN